MLTGSRSLRPGGRSVLFDAYGRAIEADTFTCKHCSKVVEVPPRRGPGDSVNFDFCRSCMAPICPQCAAIAIEKGCIPWLKRVEEYEHRQAERVRFLRDAGFLT